MRERGFDIQFQIPIYDGGEVRVRQASEIYNQAFNRLTEKAINVRSEAQNVFRTIGRATTSPVIISEIVSLRRITRARCSRGSAVC